MEPKYVDEDNSSDKFQNLLLKKLARKPLSTRQCWQFLKLRGVPPEIIEKILKKIHEWGYLNDLGLCEATLIRLKEKGWGQQKIKRYLSPHFEEDVVTKTLGDPSLEKDHEELGRAAELLEKLIRVSPSRSKGSLAGALNRKGFSFEVINRVMENGTFEK